MINTVVVRMAGDSKTGTAIADTLMAQDNKRLRAELKRTRGELRAYKTVRDEDAARKLADIRRQINRPRSIWYRLGGCLAMCVLVGQLVLDCARGRV